MKTMLHPSTLFTLLFLVFLSASSDDHKAEKVFYKNLKEKYSYISYSGGDFLMMKTEISNLDYQFFLQELRKNGQTEAYEKATVDSTGWSNRLSYCEPYKSYYHSHPAYNNYPVVNITREGAELYCNWLTEKLKTVDGGTSGLVFRLPTHDEWLYAASGGSSTNVYAWGGPYLRNSKGCYLCNFAAIGAEGIARDSIGKLVVRPDVIPIDVNMDMADITAPVESYFPNSFGLYNMNGNVAELVSDEDIVAGGSWNDPGYDVRNVSTRPYTGARPTVGFRIVASVDEAARTALKVKKP